jgi:two-component system sensor histidine kinase VicK
MHMKLVLIMVLLILSLMAVVGTFLIGGVIRSNLEEFEADMGEAFTMEPLYSALLAQAGDRNPEEMFRVLTNYAGILSIDDRRRTAHILDGATAAHLAGSDPAGLEITPNILAAMQGRIGNVSSVAENYMDFAVPVGEYIVYIRDDRSRLRALTDELYNTILMALLFGLMISAVLSFLLSKTMTTPVEQLTRMAKKIAAGELSQEVPIHSRDELGSLAMTFNHMTGVLRDTLETLASDRDKVDTLFNHMTDGVISFSRTGEPLHVNPAAFQLLGIKSAEEISYQELFGDSLPLDQALALRHPNFQALHLSRHNLEVDAAISAHGGDEGDEGGLIAVLHDITEQQRLETTRREFVSNVSHELRTPLSNIKSYTETLLEADDLPPETTEKFLNVVLGEADRMTRIVRDLLTISRIDSDKMDWHFEPVSLKDILSKVRDALLLEAGRHDHTLSLDLDMALPPVRADKERIEQVFINLISNALKYTPDGGHVGVSAALEGKHAVVMVRDDGIGIPEADRARIFERFYRVDKARSREMGGTGLGLSIAHDIITKHGGTITIDSSIGKGTTVTVRLCV